MSLLAPSTRQLGPHSLCDMAAGLATAVTSDDVTVEPGQLRGFVQLLATPSYEAWLIAWAPSGALELHDHGGAAGAVRVVSGELVELSTDVVERGPLRARTVPAGHDLAVPATCVHEVWNPGPHTALSVHVYSPRITSMTFYDHALVPTRTERR